jgi:hypothetical protein
MKQETEKAIVDMYRLLLTQHLRSRRARLNKTQVMERVRRRFDYSRAAVYRFVRKHAPELLNAPASSGNRH